VVRLQIIFSRLILASSVAIALASSTGCEPKGVSTSESHAAPDDHDEAQEAAADSIELSPEALKTIDFQPLRITRGDFERKVSLPGMVVERPGKSQIRVSAPLTGIVTRSYAMQGAAIAPGSPLFDLRLTHEELVSAQGVFLESAESLDVVLAESERLQKIAEGAIAGRRIVELNYERQKLEAKMRAQRQGLLLHGLSDFQVDEILRTRQLLKSLTVHAPSHEDCPTCHSEHPFHIQSLEAQVGQQVTAGDTIAVLADHCELYIEGTAFEEDAESLRNAVAEEKSVSADVLVSTRREHAASDLKILYIADQLDRQSRALHFYLRLPNGIILDREDNGHRFVQWRFKPGQRVELRLPVETWTERIVVPSIAVVNEGAESYVYRQSGHHFHRVPVHVEHRDAKSTVLANDGSVSPGEFIAAKGAYQIHLALKNKSGAVVDPHAGHNH
jgi:multidrug efflux pump subunit AcrA (membrane-fusion protein)